MTSFFPAAFPLVMTVFIADCEGFLTVHVLTTHRSASSALGDSV
jgi:hypothetical protein